MLKRNAGSSQAAWALLTEGVTSARIEVHRLRATVSRVLKLVEASEAKEHLYQVAGDIIISTPQRIETIERHLDRTSYALSVLGEESLRDTLSMSDRKIVDDAVERSSPLSGPQLIRSVASVAKRFANKALRYTVYAKDAQKARQQFLINHADFQILNVDQDPSYGQLPGLPDEKGFYEYIITAVPLERSPQPNKTQKFTSYAKGAIQARTQFQEIHPDFQILSVEQESSYGERPGLPDSKGLYEFVITAKPIRTADLNPPLGYPGGPCYVIDRVEHNVRNPNLKEDIIDEVEDGKGLSNPEAGQVYSLEIEHGPPNTKIQKILFKSHAQYRMDLRGITVPAIRAALADFLKAYYKEKSEQSYVAQNYEESFMRGEPINWVARKLGLTIVFTFNGKEATIVTAYWTGEADPRPPGEGGCQE